MIKVGDVLKTKGHDDMEVVMINKTQWVLNSICTGIIHIWYEQDNGDLISSEKGYTISLTPKPVYDGAFGESVKNGEFWQIGRYSDTGRYTIRGYSCSAMEFEHKHVFTSELPAKNYADALNCLQIDLRKNSVVPVDGVKQWSLSTHEGKLHWCSSECLNNKLNHALPWYETKEEAEKHLADSERIIKSLKTVKGV